MWFKCKKVGNSFCQFLFLFIYSYSCTFFFFGIRCCCVLFYFLVYPFSRRVCFRTCVCSHQKKKKKTKTAIIKSLHIKCYLNGIILVRFYSLYFFTLFVRFFYIPILLLFLFQFFYFFLLFLLSFCLLEQHFHFCLSH